MAVEGKEMASTLPWPGAGAGTVPGRAAPARDREQDELSPLLAWDLHEALSDARIQTLYQPIVRMADRRPVALEVLARLEHPAHGTLLPSRFIPPMEAASGSQRSTWCSPSTSRSMCCCCPMRSATSTRFA